ncbi:OadG family protein [Ferrimonas balearica]|uniref:OadG family protein n=1 Tax=Ferrimonas balearica TaxID=44012 RepID=UPI001FEDDC59|nr:OadG family transporter subunit [Ferrimonas balearica]
MESLAPLLSQAAQLMLMGMVLVFCFLGSLVVALKLLARAYAPEPVAPQVPVDSESVDPAVVAAISAAIHAHCRAQ